MDFSIAAIAIAMAAGDPSFRSIPGYGERAVAWDIRQQRKQLSAELGWQVRFRRVEPLRDAIEMTVFDSTNQPVSHCSGTVRLFHYTRVAEQLRAEWIEQEPGRYVASVHVAKPGSWQLEMEIGNADGRRFWLEQSVNWIDSNNSQWIPTQ